MFEIEYLPTTHIRAIILASKSFKFGNACHAYGELCSFGNNLLHLLVYWNLVFGMWNIILHTCHILASYLATANFMPSFLLFFFSSLSVRGLRLFCQCVIFTIYVLLCVCKSSHIYFICTVKSWGDFCILLPHRCKSAVKWFNSSKRFLLYTFITWTIMQFSWFYSAFSRSHSQ